MVELVEVVAAAPRGRPAGEEVELIAPAHAGAEAEVFVGLFHGAQPVGISGLQ